MKNTKLNQINLKPVLVEWNDSRRSSDMSASTLMELIEPAFLLEENDEFIVLVNQIYIYAKENEYRYHQVIPRNRVQKITPLTEGAGEYLILKWNDSNSGTANGSKTKADIMSKAHVDTVYSIHKLKELDGDILKVTGGYIYKEKDESKNVQIFSKKFIEDIIYLFV